MKTTRLRPFSLAAALGACLLTTAGRAAADPVISDGSFEDPAYVANSLNEVSGQTINGWFGNKIATSTHEYFINGNIQDLQGRNYGITPFGNQYLGINSASNNFHSVESQSVTGLTVGQAYALTLYIANLDGASDANISLSVEPNATGTGTPQASATFSAPKEGPYGQGYIDFVPETLTFTATSTVIDFNISNQSRTGVMGVDNVSIAAVPEPTTTAAMLLGTAALAGVVLRRRRVN